MRSWILLAYSVPRQPSARRVYVWRKLKRLGAVLLQDSVWVLPANAQTREHFQWLAAEIEELKGEATLWEADLLAKPQEDKLIRQFTGRVDDSYRELLIDLKRKSPDLSSLARRYQQVAVQDYFHSTLGGRVRAALLKARAKERPKP